MAYRKILIIWLSCLCLGLGARAQVSVDFIPAISGSTIDGLLNVRLTNTGARKQVRLEVSVSNEDEVGTVQVVHIATEPFELNMGVNTIPPSIVRSARVRIGNNAIAAFLQQNGYFPAGNYVYDYRVFYTATQELALEQTFVHELEPAAPLNLVEPYDRDELCEQRPLLGWQPHVPMISGVQYQVVLAEVKAGQNGIEALNYNLPIISQKGIMANMLMYPAVARELERGKRYAWQVTAYKGQTVLNRSEVWSFVLKCPDTTETARPQLSYRDIEDLAKGNFYLAQGRLSFVLVNSYAEQPLQYAIACLTDPGLKIRNLPKRTLVRGKNKVDIDLGGNSAFRQDYSYMLTVVMPNGQLKNLRFVYRQ